MQKVVRGMTALVVMACSSAFVQNATANPVDAGADAVAQFERHAVKVQEFFAAPRKLIVHSVYEGSRFNLAQLRAGASSYDVQRTDSLVSPFTAYIKLSIQVVQNGPCGTIRYGRTGIGWPTEAEALASASREDCFTSRLSPQDLKLNYAFQQGHWVFKSAVAAFAEKPFAEDSLITSALGTPSGTFAPVTGVEALAFNAPWRDALVPSQ